jgi:hypothetical protein
VRGPHGLHRAGREPPVVTRKDSLGGVAERVGCKRGMPLTARANGNGLLQSADNKRAE